MVVLGGAGAEGEFADEQRDGEPDPGEQREPEDVPPAQALGELGAGEPLDQPGGAENADGLAHDQADDDAEGDRVGQARAEPTGPVSETPAAKKANTGTANPADSGRHRCSKCSASPGPGPAAAADAPAR